MTTVDELRLAFCSPRIIEPVPYQTDTPDTAVRSTSSVLNGRSMTDETEDIRKQMLVEINAEPGSREYLEQKHGQVWDTGQLSEDFEALGFMAPIVVVRRRSDGVKGSMMFQHSPRFYFGFEPHRP